MKINRLIIGFVSFMSQISFGQNGIEKMLQGKIIVDSIAASGVNILNTANDKTAVSNKVGDFIISAKINDVLVFTSLNLESHRLQINLTTFSSGVLFVKMSPKTTALKEVVVGKKEFSAVSLGIMSKAPKSFSPAERQLQTAGDFKPIMLLGLLGGSMELDPLINKINGRTKRLKKLVVLEKKEIHLNRISELYTEDFFTNKLGISSEYVGGFKYYIVENDAFLKVLSSKNEEEITFFMITLAQEYKALIVLEK
ncbi:hypothetical protein J3S90_02560 [Flavobacterium sp. P4023]|uniref:CarboxypepD_reg-like domain-containing protein n=1 Tax=Flavobacterium flabelliforme TaxID=2816119 RepID=A0ABS5CPY8_9FLAO|nr:hypothetical protein [Flavobacterium flabelliforme]MBP4140679.1 hypothetical protein [Flavobacterium flabelliforme]